MSGARILVADADPGLLRSLKGILQGAGYDVAGAESGESCLEEFGRRLPDLVLSDLVFPGMDGFEVCRAIRDRSQVAIIILSARGDESTKLEAFAVGADDYVTKPFGSRELVARIELALRHSSRLSEGVFRAAGVVVDIQRRTVTIDQQPISLTPREYDVLKVMVMNHDRMLTHDAILREVWGREYVEETQYLRNVILSLRRKLEGKRTGPKLITTEPGIGYRIRSEG